MTELQQSINQWLASVAALIPLGYAFAAGMVSAVNPCGFAMLPAYLGLYMGNHDPRVASQSKGDSDRNAATTAAIPAQIWQALLVAGAVTAGFVALFSSVGTLVSMGSRLIIAWFPWVTVVIGTLLVLLGLSMLLGYQLSSNLTTRIASRMGNPHSVNTRGFFIFGVSYATASLSCTLPIFLTVVGSSMTSSGIVAAIMQFVSYSLGMGLVITVITLGMALFKGMTVRFLRKALPYINLVSSCLIIVAGAYIIYYWLFKFGLPSTFD